MVEVDSPYYGLPRVEVVEHWVERTPPGFVFDVKAYSLFTEHPTPVARLPKAIQAELPAELVGKAQFYRRDAPDALVDLCWATYTDALLPLHDAGKLGVVVLQFPRWFVPGRRAHDYLEEVRDRLGHYRAAVEFRHHLWLDAEHRETTLALLGDLEMSLICVDEPQGFDSSVPPFAAATTDLAFVRFHGRNTATWEKRTRTSSERFDYWYEEAELDEWVPKIGALAGEAEDVHPRDQHQQLRPGAGQRAVARSAARGSRLRRRAGRSRVRRSRRLPMAGSRPGCCRIVAPPPPRGLRHARAQPRIAEHASALAPRVRAARGGRRRRLAAGGVRLRGRRRGRRALCDAGATRRSHDLDARGDARTC